MVTDNLRRLRELAGHLVDPEVAVLIFEALPDALFMVDTGGRIQLVNQQAELLFGYHRSELFDKSIELLVPEAKRDQHVAYRATYTAEPRFRSMGLGLHLTAMRKDGSEFPVEINLSPIVVPLGIFTLAIVRRKS